MAEWTKILDTFWYRLVAETASRVTKRDPIHCVSLLRKSLDFHSLMAGNIYKTLSSVAYICFSFL